MSLLWLSSSFLEFVSVHVTVSLLRYQSLGITVTHFQLINVSVLEVTIPPLLHIFLHTNCICRNAAEHVCSYAKCLIYVVKMFLILPEHAHEHGLEDEPD